MGETSSSVVRDFVKNRLASFLFWKAPAAVMVATAFFDVGSVGRALIWTACLSLMGGGCVANALRCGRLHCYITGPFFFLMAGASVLHGFGVVSFGPAEWTWIGVVTLVGAVTLTYVPERIWGQYARGASS